MTRDDYIAPLNAGEGRFDVEAGALLRRTIRNCATTAKVRFYEDKGLLSSHFYFRGPAENCQVLYKYFKENLDS